MKIISISPFNFFKKDDGVTNRIFFISKYLDNNYKTIHIIRNQDFNKNKDSNNFKGNIFLGSKNKFTHLLSIKVILKIINIYIKEKKNIIIFSHTLRGGFYGLLMKKLLNINYYFDNHNVEYLRFKRTGKWFWFIIKPIEKTIIKNSKKTFVCSENDKEYLIRTFKINKNKIYIIKNGVEINKSIWNNRKNIREKIRKQLNIKEDEYLLLFSGSFYYKPNIDALTYISRKLIPQIKKKRLKYKFIICGKGVQKYKIKSNNIIYIGSVKNIIDYNITSDILIAPLFSGSGTKLKIIEAIAYGLQTITTDIGAEGIEKNNFLFVKNNFDIEDIGKLLKNKKKSILQRKFSWENSLKNLKIIK